MKKKLMNVMTIIMVLGVIALAYGGIRFFHAWRQHRTAKERLAEIDAIPKNAVAVDESWEKPKIAKEKAEAEDTKVDKKCVATYQHDSITFKSYSKAWDEDKLKALCEELYKNVHGREIDYLESVTIRGESGDDVAGYHEEDTRVIEVPLRHAGTLGDNFVFDWYTETSKIVLYNGDKDTTVQSMARTLTHEYGHHFTFFYFGLEEDEIKESEYYKLRFIEDAGMRIKRNDYQTYMDYHQWYLIEIAANDYEYLMGSPTIRNNEKFYDAKERLKFSVRGDKKGKEAASKLYKDCFNLDPHENVAIPLPDQVEGLAELFYQAIGMETPKYVDRRAEANKIKIDFSRRSDMGYHFYRIKWDKPWKDKDVIYTLAAYDENDDLLGGVKSIKGNETAKAYIGQVVYHSDNMYYYFPKGYWTDMDFVRFRVVVTFPDGTVVVSPPVDKRF